MKRVISFFTRLCEAYLPDAFIFCLLLTLIVFLCGLGFTPSSATDLVHFWGREFWSLNAFAMQMVFVLISGNMLATTPLVKKLLIKLTGLAHNEVQGLVLISLFSTITCWINWGFGLIVSGIFAVEIARKLGRVNFGLFVATGYSGFLVWHGGLSGSIPLKLTGADEVLNRSYPDLTLPLSETIFASWNLGLVILLLIALPLIALWMRTDEKVLVETHEVKLASESSGTFRDKLENFAGFNLIFFVIFAVYFVRALMAGESFDINKVNFIFLFFALLLHGTPRKFLAAVQESIGNASGIVVQFPFYAGIMGIMDHSGLVDVMSLLFLKVANVHTLPFWAFISGGFVNFFVPSGGGQWVVQGGVVMKASQSLGADPAKVAMALAWGDAWTNLVQPFWALPLLALAKIGLKDIMGYCLMFTVLSGVIISAVLLFV